LTDSEAKQAIFIFRIMLHLARIMPHSDSKTEKVGNGCCGMLDCCDHGDDPFMCLAMQKITA
jgi:hypothetical protein